MSPASTYLLSIAATTLLLREGSISWKRKHESIACAMAPSDSVVLEVKGRGVFGERGGGGGEGQARRGRVEMEASAEGGEEGAEAAAAETATTLDALSAEIATRGAEEGLKDAGAGEHSASSSSSSLVFLAASAVALRASALICFCLEIFFPIFFRRMSLFVFSFCFLPFSFPPFKDRFLRRYSLRHFSLSVLLSSSVLWKEDIKRQQQ